MEKELKVSRVFQATVEDVWKLWTEPEYIRQWWGPEKFICTVAKIDFEEGRTSLVNMQAPREFGGAVHFNSWLYTKIIPFERIELVMNLADENGRKQKPTAVGMPADFPEDIRAIVTFKALGPTQTEMTVTEYANFGQMTLFAKLGLEQSLDKAVSILKM